MANDLQEKLDEDVLRLVESWELKHWLSSCCKYDEWYTLAKMDFSLPLSAFIDPPALCFRPDRKDLLHLFNKYGRLFRAYDCLRTP